MEDIADLSTPRTSDIATKLGTAREKKETADQAFKAGEIRQGMECICLR